MKTAGSSGRACRHLPASYVKVLDSAKRKAYLEYMSSAAAPKNAKCVCGTTHRNGGIWVTSTGIEHGCRYAAVINHEAWLRSAAGIIEKAGEARQEGIARTNAAALATPGGPRQLRHLEEAAKNFALAYELEN